jgi:hypothetical protein
VPPDSVHTFFICSFESCPFFAFIDSGIISSKNRVQFASE